LYAGTSVETAIAEVLLRWHADIIPGQIVMLSQSDHFSGRRVARFLPTRPLTLIDATGLGLAKIESAITHVLQLPEHSAWEARPKPIAEDIFNCDISEYSTTQQWAGWLRSQAPEADGLTWVSRQFNIGCCVALFSDRCHDALALIADPTQLYRKGSTNRRTVDQLVSQLGWVVGP
jgi:hypothetical protein